jgi:hypothetical protein
MQYEAFTRQDPPGAEALCVFDGPFHTNSVPLARKLKVVVVSSDFLQETPKRRRQEIA